MKSAREERGLCMDQFEALVNQIMREAEEDGEPVTREEAEEMAQMEMRARGITREQAEVKKERKARERKVDDDKKFLLVNIGTLVEGIQLNEGQLSNVAIKTETELSFSFRGNDYTLKLTKHRPPK